VADGNFEQQSSTFNADPKPELIGVARAVYVSEGDDPASECEPHYQHFSRSIGTQTEMPYESIPDGRDYYMTGKIFGSAKFDHDQAKKGGLHICGSPEEVIQGISSQEKELGFGMFLANLNYGDMPHEMAMKNIETFAKKVIPKIRNP
jgi:alkanesulfonate monooxygenase SsuD/methylene tetrahydromethanopterin reductase-like flavin-dependent oxidoreductase (luciferase family)